ncbi:MAG: hypothetical protein O7H39_05940 [Gammaproteobacteria bacterium]|nr:hypothetical protein [Gammaproteobacteria bacterium]
MKRPTFLEGVIVAVVLAVSCGALIVGLNLVFSSATALSISISTLAGAYILFLLSRSAERAGRVAVFALWLLSAVAAALWIHSPALLLIVHAAMIWLVRTLYFHSSFLGSVMDAALSALALGALIWAGQQTHSAATAAWCFFLVQALFVAIPPTFAKADRADDGEGFAHAYRAAQDAARRIAVR